MSDHPNSLLAYDRSEENGANRRQRYYRFVLSRGEAGATDDDYVSLSRAAAAATTAAEWQAVALGSLKLQPP
jgi:hypothetical protein